MTLAILDHISILCLDGEEYKVVIVLKVDMVKIYRSTSIDLRRYDFNSVAFVGSGADCTARIFSFVG